MTNQLTPLQCPGCGGLLRSLDARVWQCAYCESRYMLLGEETPVPGLARVVDGSKVVPGHLSGDCWPEMTADVARIRFRKYLEEGPLSELQITKIKAQELINDFNRTVGRRELRAMPGLDPDIDPYTGTILPAYNGCISDGGKVLR